MPQQPQRNKFNKLLDIVNRTASQLPDFNAVYDDFGKQAQKFSVEQINAIIEVFGEAGETPLDMLKKVLYSKRTTSTAEEFNLAMWGILNEYSKKGEKLLASSVGKRVVDNGNYGYVYERTHTGISRPCPFCEERIGVWTSTDHGDYSIFAKHKGCSCIIEVVKEHKAKQPPARIYGIIETDKQ